MRKANQKGRLLDEIKALSPCKICGCYFHPSVMDYHHIGKDKSFNLSSGCKNKSWSEIEAEISKCWLLCANCHRYIHLSKEDISTWVEFTSRPQTALESSRSLSFERP